MCSICGIFDFEGDMRDSCASMNGTLKHRGPDGSGSFFEGSVCFAHNRLAVMDIESGAQPMSITHEGKKYTIVYNGELYNMPELKKELASLGIETKTRCDTELVLWSYIIWRELCPQKLNGIFAFAVCESGEDRIFLARDRFGIKPLFYTYVGKRFLFASEVKALLSHEGVRAE
ncbi:MAG: asparagine synthetase B, partial [Ruminococcaceae bacterium]|nr:asparagine synthetase B [Oscillospiraceae bacterium]